MCGFSCCCCLVTQSCLTFCHPWTVSHQAPLSMGFSQARILEWVTISFSRCRHSRCLVNLCWIDKWCSVEGFTNFCYWWTCLCLYVCESETPDSVTDCCCPGQWWIPGNKLNLKSACVLICIQVAFFLFCSEARRRETVQEVGPKDD